MGQTIQHISFFANKISRLQNGTISHERFLKLSAEYEAEQKELTEFVQVEQNAVHIFEQDKADFDNFTAVIRKYVGVKELTPTMLFIP